MRGSAARSARLRSPMFPMEVLRIDEMVAGVEAAVALEDRDVAAGLAMDAERVGQPVDGAQGLVEGLHDDPPDVLGDPQVEDAAEEVADRLGRRRGGALASALAARGTRGRNCRYVAPSSRKKP